MLSDRSVVCFFLNFPFHAAKQILGEFRKRFIDDFDANTVAHELYNEEIIPRRVLDRILQSSGLKNEILHDHLMETSTSAALRTVCDVAIKTHGHPKMKRLGEDIKRRLEKGA